MTDQANHIILPKWLDDYIYKELKANYCKSNADITVINWDKSDVLNYLGTYFPRSYAEAIIIFGNYFDNKDTDFCKKDKVSIFDFGCGTGGELIGLLTIISSKFQNIKTVSISAFDGNQHALRLFEKVLDRFKRAMSITFEIIHRPIAVEIDDFYDLEVLNNVLTDKYDLIITCKAICEFVTNKQFEDKNPYSHFIETFKSKLNIKGVMLISDITTKNTVSNEWLVKMMDCGLNPETYCIVDKNMGYNQAISVSHSKKNRDISKIAWRIVKN